MANVTLHPPGEVPKAAQPAVETPTQRVVRAANTIQYVSDENGRQIGWRKLSSLDDLDLCEIAGGNSDNREWMLRASIAFAVREIDGEPVSRPANKQQLRALVARLEDAGMVAVGRAAFGVDENAPDSSEIDRAKN